MSIMLINAVRCIVITRQGRIETPASSHRSSSSFCIGLNALVVRRTFTQNTYDRHPYRIKFVVPFICFRSIIIGGIIFFLRKILRLHHGDPIQRLAAVLVVVSAVLHVNIQRYDPAKWWSKDRDVFQRVITT